MKFRPAWIRTAPGTPEPGFGPEDDKRHWLQAGARMRDSLFWQTVIAEERLGFQAYLFLTGSGKAGLTVSVWNADGPIATDLASGEVAASEDLDDFRLGGLNLRQPEVRRSAQLRYASDAIRMEIDYSALHEAFSYRQNPDGLPSWFAHNRLEQTGWMTGFIEFNGRHIELDRIGHRDHSWGNRSWNVPQHWKWIIAYTPDGARIVNAWIWIARGEWGFGGYVVRDGQLVPIAHVQQHAQYDDDMTQRRLDAEVVDVQGGKTKLVLETFGAMKLPSSRKSGTVVIEAACVATIDGQRGAGQFETHWSSQYLDQLVTRETSG